MWIAALISGLSSAGMAVYTTVSQRRAAEAQAAADQAAAQQQAAADQAAAQAAADQAQQALATARRIAGTLGPVLAVYAGYQIGKEIKR